MKRRDMLTGGILGLVTAQTRPPEKCEFPDCVKRGKIEEHDLLILWQHEGKLIPIHAFHAFERYMPPLRKK